MKRSTLKEKVLPYSESFSLAYTKKEKFTFQNANDDRLVSRFTHSHSLQLNVVLVPSGGERQKFTQLLNRLIEQLPQTVTLGPEDLTVKSGPEEIHILVGEDRQ